jgi:hypothetical protein
VSKGREMGLVLVLKGKFGGLFLSLVAKVLVFFGVPGVRV